MMKATVIVLLLAACSAPSEAGLLSVGGRAGIADYDGDVLFESGDVGNDLLLGAQVQLSIAPRISVEASAEYFSKSFTYTAGLPGAQLSREVDFRDVALYATVKLAFVTLPFAPIGLYAGGGPNLHILSTDIVRQDDGGPELEEEDLLEDAARGGYHVVAGMDLGGPLWPLGIFAEARYSKVVSDPKISSRSAYAGLRFGF